MTASLRAGKIVTLPTVGLFADGAAVKTVGKETFNVCHQLVDEMITVQTGHHHLNLKELNRKTWKSTAVIFFKRTILVF
jgi:threonine dehydratase